jgi:hypothetical protein
MCHFRSIVDLAEGQVGQHFRQRRSTGKVDATLALGDAREVRDIFWTSRQFYGCRYDRCGLVQESGDFINSVIFGYDKNGIGDLMKASGYR